MVSLFTALFSVRCFPSPSLSFPLSSRYPPPRFVPSAEAVRIRQALRQLDVDVDTERSTCGSPLFKCGSYDFHVHHMCNAKKLHTENRIINPELWFLEFATPRPSAWKITINAPPNLASQITFDQESKRLHQQRPPSSGGSWTPLTRDMVPSCTQKQTTVKHRFHPPLTSSDQVRCVVPNQAPEGAELDRPSLWGRADDLRLPPLTRVARVLPSRGTGPA